MSIQDIPIIKERSLLSWVNVFYACHNQGIAGLSQWCWPDGGSYYDQPAYLPQIFNLIKEQVAKAIKQKMPSTSSPKRR